MKRKIQPVNDSVVGSPSIHNPDYWWFTARSKILENALTAYVNSTDKVLDVGSADGPSAAWLKAKADTISMDMDPRGLDEHGVVGSVMDIPFADATFDVVSAFDVIEHCSDEALALAEVNRVLKPGGLFLMSVPAYEWAWTSHDTLNDHHRRYNKVRVRRALLQADLEIVRATYFFASVFPFFAADRLRTRVKERRSPFVKLATGETPPLPTVKPAVSRLLTNLSKIDETLIGARDLPFGSSVLAVGRKPN